MWKVAQSVCIISFCKADKYHLEYFLSNPYNAPTADLSQSQAEDVGYLPEFMSASGRIGRVRYLAYTVVPSIGLTFLVAMVMGIIAPGIVRNPVVAMLCYIPMLVLLFIMGARRLNDVNLSGWLSLFSLIPLINLLFGLVLLFVPGNDRTNRYGPPPQKNTTGVLVLAWLGPLILVVVMGILAAVAIPAYQSYVEKSRAARETTQQAPDLKQADD